MEDEIEERLDSIVIRVTEHLHNSISNLLEDPRFRSWAKPPIQGDIHKGEGEILLSELADDIYVTLCRLLALVRYSKSYQYVEHAQFVHKRLLQTSQLLGETQWRLAISHDVTEGLSVPIWRVREAVDILASGTYRFLPRSATSTNTGDLERHKTEALRTIASVCQEKLLDCRLPTCGAKTFMGSPNKPDVPGLVTVESSDYSIVLIPSSMKASDPWLIFELEVKSCEFLPPNVEIDQTRKTRQILWRYIESQLKRSDDLSLANDAGKNVLAGLRLELALKELGVMQKSWGGDLIRLEAQRNTLRIFLWPRILSVCVASLVSKNCQVSIDYPVLLKHSGLPIVLPSCETARSSPSMDLVSAICQSLQKTFCQALAERITGSSVVEEHIGSMKITRLAVPLVTKCRVSIEPNLHSGQLEYYIFDGESNIKDSIILAHLKDLYGEKHYVQCNSDAFVIDLRWNRIVEGVINRLKMSCVALIVKKELAASYGIKALRHLPIVPKDLRTILIVPVSKLCYILLSQDGETFILLVSGDGDERLIVDVNKRSFRSTEVRLTMEDIEHNDCLSLLTNLSISDPYKLARKLSESTPQVSLFESAFLRVEIQNELRGYFDKNQDVQIIENEEGVEFRFKSLLRATDQDICCKMSFGETSRFVVSVDGGPIWRPINTSRCPFLIQDDGVVLWAGSPSFDMGSKLIHLLDFALIYASICVHFNERKSLVGFVKLDSARADFNSVHLIIDQRFASQLKEVTIRQEGARWMVDFYPSSFVLAPHFVGHNVFRPRLFGNALIQALLVSLHFSPLRIIQLVTDYCQRFGIQVASSDGLFAPSRGNAASRPVTPVGDMGENLSNSTQKLPFVCSDDFTLSLDKEQITSPELIGCKTLEFVLSFREHFSFRVKVSELPQDRPGDAVICILDNWFPDEVFERFKTFYAGIQSAVQMGQAINTQSVVDQAHEIYMECVAQNYENGGDMGPFPYFNQINRHFKRRTPRLKADSKFEEALRVFRRTASGSELETWESAKMGQFFVQFASLLNALETVLFVVVSNLKDKSVNCQFGKLESERGKFWFPQLDIGISFSRPVSFKVALNVHFKTSTIVLRSPTGEDIKLLLFPCFLSLIEPASDEGSGVDWSLYRGYIKRIASSNRLVDRTISLFKKASLLSRTRYHMASICSLLMCPFLHEVLMFEKSDKLKTRILISFPRVIHQPDQLLPKNSWLPSGRFSLQTIQSTYPSTGLPYRLGIWFHVAPRSSDNYSFYLGLMISCIHSLQGIRYRIDVWNSNVLLVCHLLWPSVV